LGAYGAIILRVVDFDFDYIAVQNLTHTSGFNLMNEIQDGTSQREDQPLYLALNKFVATELSAGAERSAGVGLGTVVYFLCPATWSMVTDPNTYAFRDDFMGASLDTATKWVRAQSTVGNVEIQPVNQWLQVVGTSTWGNNGIYSQSGITRAVGKNFVLDLYTGANATANNSIIAGFSDGGGQSYLNFAHGIIFSSNGIANKLYVFENGTNRGEVGSGYVDGTIYRIKITLGSANNAAYYIQGGAYGALGSPTWTNITPGTTSSSTTPLYAGISSGAAGTWFVSDARIY
jgi:hypothetical protein